MAIQKDQLVGLDGDCNVLGDFAGATLKSRPQGSSLVGKSVQSHPARECLYTAGVDATYLTTVG